MKRNCQNLFLLFFISVITLTLCFLSCKKDKLTEPPVDQGDEKFELFDDTKANLIVQRIKRFDKQMKDVKNGSYRDCQYINADSALWNVESLFNTTYSFPDKNYVEKKIHELSFDICVDNGVLLMKEVNQLYDDIVASVKEVYANDGISSNKGLMSVFIEKGESRSGKLSVKVLAVTGRTDCHQVQYEPVLFGPFDYDECWYYGEYGGSCSDPYILNDAAELIEDTINYIYGYKPETKNNHRNIYVNMSYITLNGDEYWDDANNDYYVFYKTNCDKDELYLNGNELNKYYYNELRLIKEVIPNDPKYSSIFAEGAAFMEINIDGSQMQRGGDIIYNHQNYIFYGTSFLVADEEFGNPIDLLNNSY